MDDIIQFTPEQLQQMAGDLSGKIDVPVDQALQWLTLYQATKQLEFDFSIRRSQTHAGPVATAPQLSESMKPANMPDPPDLTSWFKDKGITPAMIAAAHGIPPAIVPQPDSHLNPSMNDTAAPPPPAPPPSAPPDAPAGSNIHDIPEILPRRRRFLNDV